MSSSSTASSPIGARRTLEPESVNVWGIWYAARFGKAERVRFILDHKKGVSSIDDQEQVGNPLRLEKFMFQGVRSAWN